jgi:hypothetical protein
MKQLIPCLILLYIFLQFVRFLFYEWEQKKQFRAYEQEYPKAYRQNSVTKIKNTQNGKAKNESGPDSISPGS